MLYFLKRNHSTLPNDNQLGVWSKTEIRYLEKILQCDNGEILDQFNNWTSKRLKSSMVINNISLQIKNI